MTTRQDIIYELQKKSMSVRELCQKFCSEKKDMIADLVHISKSLLPRRKLIREHAVCRGCGFVFRERVRFSTPTKCPECRHESIAEVRFRVE